MSAHGDPNLYPQLGIFLCLLPFAFHVHFVNHFQSPAGRNNSQQGFQPNLSSNNLQYYNTPGGAPQQQPAPVCY